MDKDFAIVFGSGLVIIFFFAFGPWVAVPVFLILLFSFLIGP